MNKQVIFIGTGQPLELVEHPIPPVPPKGAILKVHCAGVCHSDLHLWKDEDVQALVPGFEPPRVMGHEIAGEIYSLGSEVCEGSGDLKVGDRVIVYPWAADCQNCTHCHNNGATHCKFGMFLGGGLDGGYETFVVLPKRSSAVLLPDTIPMDIGCLVPCSGITAYNAVSLMKPNIERQVLYEGSASVLICGAGGLGLWATGIAKAILPAGTKVYVADIDASRLKDAKDRGAYDTILWDVNTDDAALVQMTKEKTGGLDGACDFVGSQVTINRLFSCLSRAGILVSIGLANGTLSVKVNPFALSNQTISGVFVGEKFQVMKVLELLQQNKIEPPPVTHFKLEEAMDVIKLLDQGKLHGRGVLKIV